MAANIEQRVNTLQSLAEASPETDRDQWYRQMADIVGMAIQAGNYPAGAERLEQLQKKLTDAKADEELIAHVTFQRMWSLICRQPARSGRQQGANSGQVACRSACVCEPISEGRRFGRGLVPTGHVPGVHGKERRSG